MAQSIEVEISANYSAEDVNRKLASTEQKIESLAQAIDSLGPKLKGEATKKIFIQVEGRDATKGTLKAVDDTLGSLTESQKKYARALNTLNGAERRSVTSLKQKLAKAKQVLNSIESNSRAYQRQQRYILALNNALNKASGIEQGSIAQKRQLAAQFQRLAENTRQGTQAQREYAAQARKLNAEIAGTNGPFNKFFGILNRIATVQAGFVAFGALIGGFAGKINELTAQQKQIEGFELALKQVGLSAIETNKALREATLIADRLGAPVQQVEKAFKRMVPSLRAVGVNAKDTSSFIESVAARSQTLGLNTEQSGRFLEAFAQVLSKGKLQAEELNQQISELDGAFRTQLADALMVTTAELEDMISSGEVTAKVFVKAFNEMENGAEELERRVAESDLTIQQLQNSIGNLKTKNLRSIGAALEPAIKAFFQIQVALEKFIATITSSQFGGFLTDTFNNIVLGIRDFINITLEATKAVGFLLEPLFGLTRILTPLLRLIVPVVAGLVSLKVASLAYASAVGVANAQIIPFLARLALKAKTAAVATASLVKLAAVNVAQSIAGWVVASKEFISTLIRTRGNLAAANTELKVYSALNAKAGATTLATAGKFALFAGVLAGVSLVLLKIVEGSRNASKSLEAVKASLDEGEKATRRAEESLQEYIQTRKEAANLPIIGAVFGLGASAEVNKQISRLKSGAEILNNTLKRVQDQLGGVGKVGDIALKQLIISTKNNIAALEGFIQLAPELRKQANESGNFILAQTIAEEAVEVQKLLDQKYKQLDVLRTEAGLRGDLIEQIDNQVTSMDELSQRIKERKDAFDQGELVAEIALLKEYGFIAKDVASREMLLAGMQEQRAMVNIAMLEKELRAIKEVAAEDFEGGAQGKADAVKKLMNEILLQEKAAVMAAKELADVVQVEVERVFEESSLAAQNYADIAKDVASSVDKVRASLSGALSIAKEATNLVFDNASRGGGFTQQQNIERARFKTLARIQSIENVIAQAKLQTAFKLQQIELQTIQAKLRGEAAVARKAGENAQADNLERSANSINETLKLNEATFEIESASLKLQAKMKDELLLQKAVNAKIGNQSARLFSISTNRKIAEQDTARALGLQRLSYRDIDAMLSKIEQTVPKLALSDDKGITAANNGLIVQEGALGDANAKIEEMKKLYDDNIKSTKLLGDSLNFVNTNMQNLVGEAKNYKVELEKALKVVNELKSQLNPDGGTQARWMGGPVQGGQTYRVNDAGLGREAFMNKFGDIKMLPAGSNMNWTAPSSGTILPAAMVKRLQQNTDINSRIASSNAKVLPSAKQSAGQKVGFDSGNLVKQMTAAMSASGGNQRITNNVTIQSQQPVTDASQIMTNVARMRLRNARRI